MEGSTQQPTTPKKALSLAQILDQLGPISNVTYTPFQPKEPIQARALLPPLFPQKPHPFDYFALFFTHDFFQTITTNTNQYASVLQIYTKEERAREWLDMHVKELYVFIGAIIYMGVHNGPFTLDFKPYITLLL
jgi:hypothetical protein